MTGGRCVVVTGAAGGIGQAIVCAFLEEGAQVFGLDRDAAAQAALASRCTGDFGPGRYLPHVVDLADGTAMTQALPALLAALGGRCDVLVNNAATSVVRPFEASDDDLVEHLFAINFKAAFRLTRALLPALRGSDAGAVVNVASELALVGAPGYTAYSATKGAILAWTRTLAAELAPERIRVNAVCPGPIDTRLLAAEFETMGDAAAARHAEISAVPLGRLGRPQDIAAVIAFLAGPGAGFVTGAIWTADGGKTAL